MNLARPALPHLSRVRPGQQRAPALAGMVLGSLLLALWGGILPGSSASQAAPNPAATAQDRVVSSTSELQASTIFLPFVVQPSPFPLNAWVGEYYANATLSGEAVYTTAGEPRIDYEWGDSAPTGLPLNNFSIRWTGDWGFETGKYTFFIFADDGVRLWLDDQLLLDAWVPNTAAHQATTTVNAEGLHRLRLEYCERAGSASVRLHWRRTDLYPLWQGNYYNEPWLESAVVFRQSDSVIQFDWGDGCPPALQCDNFSVSWRASRLFEPGTHRLYFYADEGYQLYVDGVLRREGGWYDGQGGGYVDASYTLEAGALESHQITYNFHDRGGVAEARLWIEYLERPTWNIEFYDNRSLSGSPALVDPDGEKIFFDWGLGKPRNEMPSADDFSIRWSGQRYFHSGCYRFGFFADDGVRLRVDGELLVDEWHDGRGEYHAPVTYLATGYHSVVVEYFEHTGAAELRFWWE